MAFNALPDSIKVFKKKNLEAYKIIIRKLEEIMDNPHDKTYKKVKKYPKYKCARQGNYRICFKVLNNCVYIIEDRLKVYN